jgi:hypothetical protein
LNEGASPAICERWPEASKLSILFMPLIPFTAAVQNWSVPIPMGETTPIPVTTTRIHNRVLSWIFAGAYGKELLKF